LVVSGGHGSKRKQFSIVRWQPKFEWSWCEPTTRNRFLFEFRKSRTRWTGRH
jgi:hypothetical protein